MSALFSFPSKRIPYLACRPHLAPGLEGGGRARVEGVLLDRPVRGACGQETGGKVEKKREARRSVRFCLALALSISVEVWTGQSLW